MTVALCLLGLCFGARADPAGDIRSLLVAGDPAAALLRAEAALTASPRDIALRFLRGVVLMDLARTDEALDLFTQLAQEHPELPDPYNNIGLLQARAGHLDLALLALQEALRCDPAHRVARANLGQVYLMLAARTWDELARSGPVEQALLRRLEAVRALLTSLPAGDR
jgi:Flp pilus assembly protein TadD